MKQISILFFLVFISIHTNGQKVIHDNIVYYNTERGLNCVGYADKNIEQDSIIFPDSIMINGETKTIFCIGSSAFQSEQKLRYVKFPNGLQYFSHEVMSDCPNLEEIILPSSVKSIPLRNGVFENTSLTSISIDPLNTKYDSRENSNAIIETEKNEIVLGTSKTTIPSSIVSLGHMAFKGNTRLKTIYIPSNVKSIGYECFGDCDDLNSVIFSDLKINDGVDRLKIKDAAFAGCKNIKSIILPERLCYIGHCAFHGCENLESITIPENVDTIDGSILEKCSQLTAIQVDENNKKYDSRNNCNAIIETKSNTLISACKNTTILPSIKKIGVSAFFGLDIDSIYIENGLKNIGRFAFAYSKIRTIVIPKSVKTIEDGVFDSCDNLQKIYLKHKTPPKFNDEGYAERYIKDYPNLTIYVNRKAYKKFRKDRVWQMFNIEVM